MRSLAAPSAACCRPSERSCSCLRLAGQVAALSTYYPIQSLGNRGSDVRALQYLLRAAGRDLSVTGQFGSSTQAAVVAHQKARGLPATGIVNDPTWRSLTPNLSMGSSGDAVRALQRLLNDKRKAGLTVSGTYGTGTRDAVTAFQRHMTSTSSGSMDAFTWRRLLWHFEPPVWGSTSGLCDYSVGNGPANWGTGAAIGQLRTAAKHIYDAGHGRVAVGDIGLEHGGDIPGHDTHEQGLDVDVRPMRDAREPVLVPDELSPDGVRPSSDAGADQGDPRRGPGPRQGHLLQRPGADRGGPDDAPGGPRRPSPRPLLRGVAPGDRVSLRLGRRVRQFLRARLPTASTQAERSRRPPISRNGLHGANSASSAASGGNHDHRVPAMLPLRWKHLRRAAGSMRPARSVIATAAPAPPPSG